MEIFLTGKNLYIVNKVPAALTEMTLKPEAIVLEGKHEIKVDEIYSCLYCAELKNFIFIIKDNNPHTVTMIAGETNEFTKVLNSLQNAYKNVPFSEQDKKINGYAAAITAKLQEGIETGIVDKPAQQEIKCCPMCGMECDPNIPYCMECGAEV